MIKKPKTYTVNRWLIYSLIACMAFGWGYWIRVLTTPAITIRVLCTARTQPPAVVVPDAERL